jgi:mitochondrial import inner membrane translocase subunit TIM23
MAASTSRAGLQTLRASIRPTSVNALGSANVILSRSIHSSFVRRQEGQQPLSDSEKGVAYLTWERYLNLRKQRRLAGMVTTVPSTILAAAASGSYFLTQEIDPTSSPIAGIDPVYVYALLTLGCTGM